MSIEEGPRSDYSLEELVELCELAVVEEDWNIYDAKDSRQYDSVRYCAALATQFERANYLVPYLGTMATIFPDSTLHEITLTDPVMHLPNWQGTNKSLTFNIRGTMPIRYLRMGIVSSVIESDKIYIGPHLIGYFDSDTVLSPDLEDAGMESAHYGFLTPFKDVKVHDELSQRRFC